MSQIYQEGGAIMHVITVLTAFATILLARRRRGASGSAVLHLIAAIVFAGLFGAVEGFRQVFAAVATVPPEHYATAMARGSSIALIPLLWAMATAIVLVLWNAVVSRPQSPVAAT